MFKKAKIFPSVSADNFENLKKNRPLENIKSVDNIKILEIKATDFETAGIFIVEKVLSTRDILSSLPLKRAKEKCLANVVLKNIYCADLKSTDLKEKQAALFSKLMLGKLLQNSFVTYEIEEIIDEKIYVVLKITKKWVNKNFLEISLKQKDVSDWMKENNFAYKENNFASDLKTYYLNTPFVYPFE